ncbi:hypothetical protein E4U55_000876 [Claviceps digitariae]|nr:hypothetical protein E4U55_000876 [Claviceps digitariae]
MTRLIKNETQPNNTVPYKASTPAIITPATPAKTAPFRITTPPAAFVAVADAVAVAVAVPVPAAPAEAVSLSAPAVTVTGTIMLVYPDSTVWELVERLAEEATTVQTALAAAGSRLQFACWALFV